MRFPIMLRGQAKDEREQHEADGALFVCRQNKNLSPDFLRGLVFHFAASRAGLGTCPVYFHDKSAPSRAHS